MVGSNVKDEESASLIVGPVKVVLNVSDGVPSYYVNHAEVSQTRHDFSIHFAQVPSKFSSDTIALIKETHVLPLEPMLQVTIPPTLIPGLIKALNRQRETYEEAHGEIREDDQPSSENIS